MKVAPPLDPTSGVGHNPAMNDAHAFILAGGAGTRLWPLSRRARPKQLLRLFEGRSLLQHAAERLDGLFAPDRIHVVTTADMVDAVVAELPHLPAANVIAEPALRDTANAIGLAAHLLAQQSQDAIMCVFTADHLITPRERFHAAIRRAVDAARASPESLVTFGVRPTSAHTGYGYARLGPPVSDGVFASQGFREKPDADTARAYVESGEYVWNSGMFVWRVATLLKELEQHLPTNDAALRAIATTWSQDQDSTARGARYAELPRVSIDYGVMEKAGRVLIVPLDCDWTDVGSWEAVAAVHAADTAGNVVINARPVHVGAQGNVLVADSNQIIVTVGVENLVVVQTDDVTLICARDQAQRVREAVDRCREVFGDDVA